MFCLDHGPFIQMLWSWQIIYLTLNKRSSRMRACYVSSVFKGFPVCLESKCTLWEWNKTRSVCLWWMCVTWRLHFAHKLFFYYYYFMNLLKVCVLFYLNVLFCSLHLRKVILTVAFTLFTKLISLMLWKTALFLGRVHIHYSDGDKIKYLFKF